MSYQEKLAAKVAQLKSNQKSGICNNPKLDWVTLQIEKGIDRLEDAAIEVHARVVNYNDKINTAAAKAVAASK